VIPAAWLYHRVVLDVARSTGISPMEIVGPVRTGRLVAARHAAWWLLREISGLSMAMIGRLVGRHHTSILHAIRTPSVAAWAVVLDVLQARSECVA